MEKDKDDFFTCIKCGKVYLKCDLLLHDARCKGRKNLNFNNLNRNNIFSNNNNNLFNYYKCNICGAEIKLEEKMDHLLCHELENNDIREDDRQNIYYNRNANIIRNKNREPRIIRHYSLGRIINPNRNINNNRNDNLLYDFSNNRFIFRNDLYEGNSSGSSESDKNDGLDQNTIDSFPISQIKDINKLDEEKKKCLICLENFKTGEYTIILPCIHIFHSDCIKRWMKAKNICPICKYKIDSFE